MAWNLLAAWLLGIGGCDILAWLGSYYDGPFRLVAGLWMLITGLWVWRKWYPRDIAVFSLAGWRVGLIILVVVLMHPMIGGLQGFHAECSRLSPVYFAWCVVVIGFAEELWWRGIWFEMFKGKPIICIVAGSLAFTAYHFPFQGFELMIGSGLAIRIFFLGLLFASARYRGTSIGVLALAHGLIDWLQGAIEFQKYTGPVPFAVCCAILTAIVIRGHHA